MYLHQVKDFKTYLNILKKEPNERTQLMKNLTVNLTRFFRNSLLFDVLENDVLKKIIERKQGNNIKIWSAGCSSGEEPYTIAILMSEICSNKSLTCNFEIFATDIDDEALNTAVMGEYSENQMIETPEKIAKKYFRKEGEVYVIKDEIKKLVHFMHHDLFHDKMLKKVDMILCRNVVIYFTAEAKNQLYKDFYYNLNPGGYLIMGKSENLGGDARKLFRSVDSDEKVYQRPLQ